MNETPQEEFDLLRMRADAQNLYVNRHKQWDATRGTGDLYLQTKKKFRSEKAETIMRYATADDIHAALAEVELKSPASKP